MKTAGAYCVSEAQQFGLYFCCLKSYCTCFFLGLHSFQFVVSDSGDYAIHAMDPDVLVEWDFIEQVVSFFLHYSVCANKGKMLVAMFFLVRHPPMNVKVFDI